MLKNTSIKELEEILKQIQDIMDSRQYQIEFGRTDRTRNNLAQHTLIVHVDPLEPITKWEKWDHSPTQALLVYGLLFAAGFRNISEVTYRGELPFKPGENENAAVQYTFFVQGGPAD